MVDELAERIRSIGGKSIGTLIEFTDETRLSEVPKEYPHADKMLENLLLDHESIIRQLRRIWRAVNSLETQEQQIFLQQLWKNTKRWLGC